MLLPVAVAILVATATLVTSSLDSDRRSLAVVTWLLTALAVANGSVLLAGAVVGQLTPLPLLGATLVVGAMALGVVALWGGGLALPFGLGHRRDGEAISWRESDDGDDTGAIEDDDDPAEAVSWVNQAMAIAWRHPFHVLIVAIVGAMYAWHTYLALRLPIVDYDGLALHAAAVAHWVTSGSIAESGLASSIDAAPLGPAAISSWSATFTDSLHHLFATQLAFSALGIASVATLARQLGAALADSVLAGAAFAAVPVVALQATSAYPDLGATASVLAAWALGIEAYRSSTGHGDDDLPALGLMSGIHGAHAYLALAGVALGLAIASRPANLAALVLFVAVLAVSTVVNRRTVTEEERPWAADEPASLRSAAMLGAVRVTIVVGSALLVGGYWYIRNWISHGNPLHPFSWGPFDGTGSVERLLIGPNRPDSLEDMSGGPAQILVSWASDLNPDRYAVDQRLGGFGPAFTLLVLPGLILYLSQMRAAVRPIAIGLFGSVLALLLVQPAPWWSRGTLFVPAVVFAAVAAVLSHLPDKRRLALGAVTVLLAWGVVATTATTVYTNAETRERIRASQMLGFLSDGNVGSRVSPYHSYHLLDDLPAGSVIAVIDGRVPAQRAPIFGEDLDRRIAVVEATSDASELAAAMQHEGAAVALVSTRHEALLESIAEDGSALEVLGEGGNSPLGTVVVGPSGR